MEQKGILFQLKKFREINSLIKSLVKPFPSRNFAKKASEPREFPSSNFLHFDNLVKTMNCCKGVFTKNVIRKCVKH